MKTIGKIKPSIFAEYFGELQSDEVIITDERIRHIMNNHPDDYKLFCIYSKICISSPDLIITDERSIGTVYYIKKLNGINLNAVLRLALSIDKVGLKNSIMTFWKIRDKNLLKLINKNKLLYKKE